MDHKIIFAGLGLITLVTCKNQQATATTSENTATMASETHSSTSTKPEPEMAPGLPPDKEAVKQAEKEAAAATANQQGIVYLNEGENKFLKEYQMNVTFKEMAQDSRCPADVNCVWEGAATAEVEVMGLATRPMTLQISTLTDAGKGYEKTQFFNGYNITLMSVTPGTTSAKGFSDLKGKYKIGLKFTKSTGGATTTK